jgi:hypothetical protein
MPRSWRDENGRTFGSYKEVLLGLSISLLDQPSDDPFRFAFTVDFAARRQHRLGCQTDKADSRCIVESQSLLIARIPTLPDLLVVIVFVTPDHTVSP